jgi:hypothetical protein
MPTRARLDMDENMILTHYLPPHTRSPITSEWGPREAVVFR